MDLIQRIPCRIVMCGLILVVDMLLAGARVGQTAEPKVEVVLDGLDHPTAVAVQPESGLVYIVESARGRVIRVVDGQLQEVITGLPVAATAEEGRIPAQKPLGPLGLAFLGPQSLAVGGGGEKLGEDFLALFQLQEAAEMPLQADAATNRFQLPADGAVLGEGGFYGVAVSPAAIFATCRGDEGKGWVARAEREAEGKFSSLERWLPTTERTQVPNPMAATFSPQGLLVIGQTGKFDSQRDARLTFYSPHDSQLLLNLATGLFDLTGLAYGPDQLLYATDLAHAEPASGGLFRLVAKLVNGRQTCEAQRVLPLDRPTALAVGKEGAWYITVLGTAPANEPAPVGKLLRVTW